MAVTVSPPSHCGNGIDFGQGQLGPHLNPISVLVLAVWFSLGSRPTTVGLTPRLGPICPVLPEHPQLVPFPVVWQQTDGIRIYGLKAQLKCG